MSKPTIFFSHSSKDKDIILSIKGKFDSITGGTMDIFMSSDGQSIPFGRNWIYKIEDGLNSAEIMFVFVTPNSILSNWIYFEAGFAYAKGIEVIPVGVGIDIGLLKAPLNLLQGFNIVSSDSLNNFITIINRKFDYHFRNDFCDSDFSEIIAMTNGSIPPFDMSNIFSYADCELLSEYQDTNGRKVSLDFKTFIDQIIAYLKSDNIAFSYEGENRSTYKCILTSGIKIIYQAGAKAKSNILGARDTPDKISVKISLYSFQTTFPILSHILSLIQTEWTYLCFHLNSNYAYITSQETASAIISTMKDNFEFSNSLVGRYRFTKSNLPFFIYNTNTSKPVLGEYVMNISYQPKNTTAGDIIECVRLLLDGKLIYQKGEHNGE